MAMSRSRGRDVVDDVAADPDLAAGDLLEAGDHAQRGRLAAAGGADEDDEFVVGDLEVDAADGLHAAFVGFDDLADRDFCHDDFPRFMAGVCSVAGGATSALGVGVLSGIWRVAVVG